MRLGSKVLCLVRDPAGFGPSLFQALQPRPNSDVIREDSCFELPIAEKYGIKEEAASIHTAQFYNPGGSLQVSILLLPNLETATFACIINEILLLITSDKSDESSLLMSTCYVDSHKIAKEIMPSSFNPEVKIYATEIGVMTDSTQQMLAGVPKVPPTLRIYCEPLNCLVHLAQVYKLPAILLVATGKQSQGMGATDQELEALYEAGEFFARHCSLSFFRERVCKKQMERLVKTQEPWRSLYG